MLPESLGDAIERFRSSKLMKEVLGEHIHEYLSKRKTREWKREFPGVGDEVEIDRQFEVL